MYTSTGLLDTPIREAHRLVTVDSRPPFVALAALALHLVVLFETLLKMLEARCGFVFEGEVVRVEEFVDLFVVVTVC
jgi:hypothetical protein